MRQPAEHVLRGDLDGGIAPPISRPRADVVLSRSRPHRSPRGHGQGVLVVEEDMEMREVVRDALEDLGYRPTVATSVREALAAVEGNGFRPDVLVADLNLSELSGVNLASRLSRTVSGLAVLFVSGDADVSYLDGALTATGTVLIQAPFEEDDLAQALDYLISRRDF
jgi:CheY-like chemotaxis protein